jgi:hypothetical protein
MSYIRPAARLGAGGLVILLLAACGSGSSSPAASAPAPAAGSPTAAGSALSPASPAPVAGLVVTDAWVKSAASGMTSVFGVVRNTSAVPVTILSASTPAAGTAELHETVEVDGAMQMRRKAGGFVLPPGGALELTPGGNHIMLLGLSRPVKPGDVVVLTLTLDGGRQVAMQALAKDFAGANESYAPSASPMAGMS